jgi:iron complex outermembrane receptor protein
MSIFKSIRYLLLGIALPWVLAAQASGSQFDISGGDLKGALDSYAQKTGIAVLYLETAVEGVHTKGAKGEFSDKDALAHILAGTGFVPKRHPDGTVVVVRELSSADVPESIHVAAATAPSAHGTSLETVTVTSSKIGGDVQNIPISITALSQEQLTATQTAGGPDLIKQVPNMSFTKTNFTGYSIQLRGIGTQAISVTTDPAVAVAFNDVPFIRNHFFEQEFYDVSQVEVLRGPQGTLYGRNATAGVVNLISAKPTDQFEAMASLEIGNYGERRPEGMINIPIVDDRLDIRVAGEWTKRQGYSFNELTGDRIDGRDLWSGRVSIGWKPIPELRADLVWEHFSEDDDRLRSSKQLCKTDPIPTSVGGAAVPSIADGLEGGAFNPAFYLSQACSPTSLYSSDAYEVPNGYVLPFVRAADLEGDINDTIDPYASTTQSRNLRVIQTTQNPRYQAKSDVVELNTDYNITPSLTLTSQTAFNHDFLWSEEDYNRFDTNPGLFIPSGDPYQDINAQGVFCDPQVGCSDRLVATDLSDEHAWQLSQEFRVTSNFSGPLNFSAGGNYLHYETEENYYVFINTLTMYTVHSDTGLPWVPGVSDNHQCLIDGAYGGTGYEPLDPRLSLSEAGFDQCNYIDPNPINKVNNEGHNYFLSQNPYMLNSYAAFGEVYYNVLSDLKLTTGLRWTEDRKHFVDIPSELLTNGWGYFITGAVDQQWDQFTGRAAVNWTPKLDFTDQTLVYGSYAHGYKAGGANPPGAALLTADYGTIGFPDHPLTFKPEFIDAFELGSKNTLLDGSLTVNGDVFYYNYENYQISEIVDRTAINQNFDAHVKGAELEGTYEPIPGLRFNFAGGWEDTAIARGAQAIDLMDRTAGHAGWIVVKPFPTQASNCILPDYVIAALLNGTVTPAPNTGEGVPSACDIAYQGLNAYFGSGALTYRDPGTGLDYVPNPVPGYAGYDPLSVDPTAPANVNNGLGLPPNNGEGFDKNLSGHKLPNAPPFTVSAGAQYTMPLSQDWAGTLRGDYYWQDSSWARVFNDNPYDRLRGYTNVNLTLIFTNQNGWQVMLYDKNVFNTTAITGDFLNSDDSGLTTNVFLTDPKLIGIRVTKNW